MKKFTILAATVLAFSLAACQQTSSTQTDAKSIQAKKAAEAANSIQFSENAEIENIKRRLELTSKPSSVGYILLLNQMGQPILYTGVKGKVTSGSKRLTQPEVLQRCDGGEYRQDCVMPGPSDEGTYGSSDPYIYFWTTSGQYIQWSGTYLYSDKPIRTRVAPLVIDTQAG